MNTIDIEPEWIADYACETGEGPLWHPVEQRLYWLDITKGRIFRYHPASGKHEPCYEGEAVGGMTLQADGTLLLFMARGAIRLWKEEILDTLVAEIPEEADSRFNDVIADPAGRVYCGTIPSAAHSGRLYRLRRDGSLSVVIEDAGISNGLGFTPNRTVLYHTNSLRKEISCYDYHLDSGDLANRRLFARLPEGQVEPDGLTVDAEGYVWSARWDGWSLVRHAPDGAEVMRVDFPAAKVTSVTFGGPDYTDLYVTTAGGDDKQQNGPGAGALFRINLGIRGVPEFPSKIGLSDTSR
jgi:D-xylono/L-arabinono-1,4-lactonase